METSTMGKTRTRLHSQTRRNHYRLRRVKAKLRIISNIGLIVGQCVLLFVSRDIGLIITICSSLLSVPFFLKEKMWDVLLLIAVMQIINFAGLFFQ
jgi:hypothetical protein